MSLKISMKRIVDGVGKKKILKFNNNTIMLTVIEDYLIIMTKEKKSEF